MSGLVCAFCDVWCRAERAYTDPTNGEVIMRDACAYCGRRDVRLGKQGRQTARPKEQRLRPVDDGDDAERNEIAACLSARSGRKCATFNGARSPFANADSSARAKGRGLQPFQGGLFDLN
jgi:hypothetical protein